ncbi:hypothetical protein F4703DRAFT_1797374 [Phycomyces blakesleeanus]
MLLVPSVQVKHQGSDQSPRISIHSIQVKLQGSGQGQRVQVKVHGYQYPFHPGQASRFTSRSTVSVSIPSRASFKVQVKVSGFRSRSTVSVSIPSRSSFKVQVKVHGFQYPIHPGKASMFRSPSYGHSFYLLLVSTIQVKCQGPDFPTMGIAIDVRRQGSDLPAMCSIIQVNQQDSDLPSMVIVIHVKRPGSDLPAMVLVFSHPAIHVKRSGSDLPTMFTAIRVKRQGPDRPSMVIAIRVKHQEPDPPSMVIVIDVKRQGPDRPSMLIVIQDKHHGFDLPAMFKSPAIQDKHQGSDLPAMVIAIQVKCQGTDRPAMGCSSIDVRRQGSDLPAMCSIIQVNQQDSDLPSMCSANHVKRPGSHLPAMVIDVKNIMGIYSLDLIYLQSPAIQIKHQDSDLPAMVIDLIYLQSPAIQVKHQDSHLPAMGIVLNPPRSCFTDPDSVRGYRPNSKDQNSNLGYSSNIKDLISNQGYGYTLFSLSLHAFFRIGLVCLRSGYTMKNLFSFQCDRYIHLVWPLVTVGFISILASQSKPAIMDPISVQRYSVLAVKVPLLSMPMIPNPSPIQSDRATIKNSISIQYDSVFTAQVEEQGFLLHPRLQPRPIDPGLLSSRPKPTIKALIFFWAHSKRSMLSSTSKVAVHAENQGCTSKNRVKTLTVETKDQEPDFRIDLQGYKWLSLPINILIAV